jgi:predicted nucleotidyltransferase
MNSTALKADDTFGLSARDIRTLRKIFMQYPEITTVYLFGSRAKGTYHAGSDIDVAVMDEAVSDATLQQLRMDMEESDLPYFVDIVHFSTLQHAALQEHIRRVGQCLYKREN